MRTLRTRLLLVALLAVPMWAVGCSQSKNITGRPILQERVDQIRDGTTTSKEILAMFGAPTERSQLGDHELFIYKYCRSAGEGLALPYFHESKTQERCDELTVTFDRDSGIVEGHSLQRGINAGDEVGG